MKIPIPIDFTYQLKKIFLVHIVHMRLDRTDRAILLNFIYIVVFHFIRLYNFIYEHFLFIQRDRLSTR